MKCLGDVAGPAYFVLLDFHQYLSDPLVCRALKNLFRRANEENKLSFSSRLLWSYHRTRQSVIIDLSLPTSIGKGLKSVASSERVELSGEIVSPAFGFGAYRKSVRANFSKVIVTHKGLSEDCLSEIVSEKAVLRQSDVLEFFELNSSIDEVGGWTNSKLGSLIAAFNQARTFGRTELATPWSARLLSRCAKAVAHLWKFPLQDLILEQCFHSQSMVLRFDSTCSGCGKYGCCLWIDELEKGLGGNENRSEQASHVLGSFISWLSEKTADVFVVATANDVSALPPELLRKGRFDEIFFVDLPNKHERLEVLTVHLRKRGRNPEDFPKLFDLAAYCEQFSGAELEQVVIAALYHAFSERRELSFEDLLNSAKATIPLYQTFEEQIKHLRDWASTRAAQHQRHTNAGYVRERVRRIDSDLNSYKDATIQGSIVGKMNLRSGNRPWICRYRGASGCEAALIAGDVDADDVWVCGAIEGDIRATIQLIFVRLRELKETLFPKRAY